MNVSSNELEEIALDTRPKNGFVWIYVCIVTTVLVSLSKALFFSKQHARFSSGSVLSNSVTWYVQRLQLLWLWEDSGMLLSSSVQHLHQSWLAPQENLGFTVKRCLVEWKKYWRSSDDRIVRHRAYIEYVCALPASCLKSTIYFYSSCKQWVRMLSILSYQPLTLLYYDGTEVTRLTQQLIFCAPDNIARARPRLHWRDLEGIVLWLLLLSA